MSKKFNNMFRKRKNTANNGVREDDVKQDFADKEELTEETEEKETVKADTIDTSDESGNGEVVTLADETASPDDDFDVIDIASDVEYKLNQERTGVEVVRLEKNKSARGYNAFDLFMIKFWAAIVSVITYISQGICRIFNKIFRRELPLRYVKAGVSIIAIILLIVIILAPFNLTVGQNSNVDIFSNSLIPVARMDNGILKWGYANKKGKEVIPCQFYAADPFYNNVAFVKVDESTWRLIGTDGKFKGSLMVKTSSENDKKPVGDFNNKEKKAWIRETSGYTFVNTNGKYSFGDIHYDMAESFSDGYAMVQQDNDFYFIDKYGKQKSPTYFGAQSFSEGLAAVRKSSGWTFVNTSFKEVGTGSYSSVTSFKNGYAWVMSNESIFIIDRNGKPATPTGYNDMIPSDEILQELHDNFVGNNKR